MKKIRSSILNMIQLDGISIKTMPVVAAISIALVTGYIKSVDTNLTQFYDRAIGAASINGVDAPVRISAFWTCVALFAGTLILGSCFIKKFQAFLSVRYPDRSFQAESQIFFEFGLLLLIHQLVFLTAFVKARATPMPALIWAVLAVVSGHLFLNLFAPQEKRIGYSAVYDAFIFIAPISLTYLIFLFISCVCHSSVIVVNSIEGFIVYFLLSLAVRFAPSAVVASNAAIYVLIPFSLIPSASITANEIQYTLTKHGLLLDPQTLALWISAVLLLLSGIIYQCKYRTDLQERKQAVGKLENIVIPILLATLSLFAWHTQTIAPSFDFLHTGNMIVPAQQLYQFGEIPLLDYWAPQHWPIGAWLYCVFNGYNFFEPLLWHQILDNIINVLIVYFALRQFTSAKWAALLICFTPILIYANTYYCAALLPLVYLNRMRKNRRIRDFAIMIGLALIAFVYMASIGKIAVLSSLIMIGLSCTSKKDAKNALLGVLGVLVPLGTLYFALALMRGESIVDRITLIAAMADCDIKIGSYTTFIGAGRTPFEIITYYGLFPLSSILSLFFAGRVKKKENMHYALIFLSTACLLSALRGFARHSLVEGLPIDFYLLQLVLLPFVFVGGKSKGKLISMLIMAIIICTPYTPAGYGTANSGIKNFEFQKFEIGSERCDTVNSPSYPTNLRKVLDSVLTDDQTFYEGVNSHLLYALMERESPFMLCAAQIIYAEPPQEVYIRLFEKAYESEEIPLVIYGGNQRGLGAIDGIPVELSLFKLDDFIYTHYEPWISVDGFHLWKAKNVDFAVPSDTVLQEIPAVPTDVRNDLFCRQDGNQLKLVCGETDPFVGIALPNPLRAASLNEKYIKLRCSSSVAGPVQLFFDFTGFNETDSAWAEVVPSLAYQDIWVPIPAQEDESVTLKNIRIDPPANSEFIVQSISVVSRDIVYTDKQYLQQDFDMIKLPYIWGNYDEKVQKNHPVELQKVSDTLALEADVPITLPLEPDVKKENGNYIAFRISAAEPGSLLLTYGNDIINSCRFDIVAGDWEYLVRISTQYNWVNEPQSEMTIQSSVPVIVEKTAILEGD